MRLPFKRPERHPVGCDRLHRVSDMKVKLKIVSVIVWLITLPMAVAPYRFSLKIGGRCGALFCSLMSGRRRIAENNVKESIAAGELDGKSDAERIVRESFINIGKSAVEMIKFYHGLEGEIIGSVKIEGEEHYRKALEAGKGVVMITGHCGNWELLALTLNVRFNTAIHVVARAQNNPYLDHLVEKMRSRKGNSVIYKEGAVRRILKEIKSRNVVGILIDQAVLVKEGCALNFLGRPAMTTKLPAILALKTGSPVVPCFIRRNEDDSHTIRIYPEVKLLELEDKEAGAVLNMQKITGVIEDYIKKYPEQWLWGHRRWKRAPERFEPGEDPKEMLKRFDL